MRESGIGMSVTTVSQVLKTKTKRRVVVYICDITSNENLNEQMEYYKTYVESNPHWELISIYTEEGTDRTNGNRRPAFIKLMQVALSGMIDLIVTISISRFGKNTIDTIKTILELKAVNVEVYFEQEDIYTLDTKGELLINLMSSATPSAGDILISGPEQEKTVRFVYILFLEGRTYGDITKVLNSSGIKTPTGKLKWSIKSVIDILTNEKYCNEGNNGPIVTKLHYDEIQKIKNLPERKVSKSSPFSGKLRCGNCGCFFKRKSWESGTTQDFIWECPQRYKGLEPCLTPHIYEDQLERLYAHIFMDRLISGNRVFQSLCAVFESKLSESKCEIAEEYLTQFFEIDPSSTTQDSSMWMVTVKSVTVHEDYTIEFKFIDGTANSYFLPNRRKENLLKAAEQADKEKCKMIVTEIERSSITIEKKIKMEKLREEGFSYKEISEILGIKRNSIKSYFYRVRESERKKMGQMSRCVNCCRLFLPTSENASRRFCSSQCETRWWELHPKL